MTLTLLRRTLCTAFCALLMTIGISVATAGGAIADSTSGPAITLSPGLTEINDTDPSIAYSGGWAYITGKDGYFQSDAHYSGTAGATATLTFTGTTVAWIGGDNTDHGRANVAVCDATGANCGTATEVDTYATDLVPDVVLFTASGLSPGTHTLIITVRPDTSGTGYYTDVDAFEFGTPNAALSGTHYVDDSAGSQCTDSGPGTSPSTPWCDFADLDGQIFAPGAQILLKRGDTFTGELGRLYGSGTSTDPIVLGAYGTGALPEITGTGQATDRAVWIQDASYWTVSDLDLSDVGAGLVFWYATNGHAGLTVTDVDTEDVQGVFAGSPAQTDLPGMYHSAGILITGDVAVTASETAVTGVALSDLQGYDNDDDVDISGFDANSGGQQGFLSTTLGHHSVSQVSLSESSFDDDLSGENFDNLQDMSMTGVELKDTGNRGNSWGTTALFFWSSSTVTVADDILNAEPGSDFSDGLDGWPYSTGHTGYLDGDAHYITEVGASAVYPFTGTTVTWIGGENTDHGEADVAVCDANGDNCGAPTVVNTYAPTAQTQQNLYTASGLADTTHTLEITVLSATTGTDHYIDVDGFISGTSSQTTEVNDTDPAIVYTSGWTLNDDTAVNASTAYNAAYDFSATQGFDQWHEQYYTPSGGWQDINPYESSDEHWGDNGYVSRFDLSPDTCSTCPIARAWVAPNSGTVLIAGRVLKETVGGDGVTARITDDGTQIWPASGGAQTLSGTDTSGYDTDVTIPVSAGDILRFEVTNGGDGDATDDVTAWVPSIAYQ